MYVYESVGEFGRKIGSCKLCLMCQERKKKYRKETHEKKLVKEKKSEKKEKFKSKECVSCEKKK